MKGSKEFFLELREQEVQTDKFLPSKKELVKKGIETIKDVVESGDYNLNEIYAFLVRQKTAIETMEKQLKDALPQENFEEFGIKATYKNGGDMPQFTDDPIYAELKNILKEREDLLKSALKQDKEIYDAEGIEVPKVSTKPRKSSLTINF